MEKNEYLQDLELPSTNGESNILVAIRVRPLNSKETSIGDFDIIRIEDKLIVKMTCYKIFCVL